MDDFIGGVPRPYKVPGILCPICRTPLTFINENIVIDGEEHPAVADILCPVHGDQSEYALRQLEKFGRYTRT